MRTYGRALRNRGSVPGQIFQDQQRVHLVQVAVAVDISGSGAGGAIRQVAQVEQYLERIDCGDLVVAVHVSLDTKGNR
jgi:hypothetical protein